MHNAHHQGVLQCSDLCRVFYADKEKVIFSFSTLHGPAVLLSFLSYNQKHNKQKSESQKCNMKGKTFRNDFSLSA